MPANDRHANRPLVRPADAGRVRWSTEAIVRPEPWMADAVCGQTDPEAFFPEKGASTRVAKKLCGTCEVAQRCLLYALDHDERFGIWGGKSERERRRMRRTRRLVVN